MSRAPRPTPAVRRATAGLTVVELMISLVISSIVAASTFVFFAGQQRIYETQTKMLNVQQNVWGAMEMVTRYVRSGGAGMVGCVRPDSDGEAGPDTGAPPPVGAVAPATGLRAFRNGVGAVRIPPIWINNGAAGAPDSITVAFGNGTFGNYNDATLAFEMTANEPATDPVRVAADSLPVFRAGEFIVLLDTGVAPASGNLDRGCTLFQVTGTDVATNTLLRSSAASSWNPGANVAGLVPWTYQGAPTSTGGVRNFGELNWVQFSVAPATLSEPPRLMMTRLDNAAIGAQILAEGIEDMQIAYACDTAPVGGDGVLTEGNDAASRALDEWVLNQAGEAIPAGCNKPSAVRITLIARSLTPDDTLADLAANAKPAIEDGAAGARDTFRHRVITTTVFPRN